MKKIILSTVIATSFLLSGIASATPSNPYIATDTDTFWTISQKLNINISALMAANPQVDPYNIYKGQNKRSENQHIMGHTIL